MEKTFPVFAFSNSVLLSTEQQWPVCSGVQNSGTGGAQGKFPDWRKMWKYHFFSWKEETFWTKTKFTCSKSGLCLCLLSHTSTSPLSRLEEAGCSPVQAIGVRFFGADLRAFCVCLWDGPPTRPSPTAPDEIGTELMLFSCPFHCSMLGNETRHSSPFKRARI